MLRTQGRQLSLLTSMTLVVQLLDRADLGKSSSPFHFEDSFFLIAPEQLLNSSNNNLNETLCKILYAAPG